MKTKIAIIALILLLTACSKEDANDKAANISTDSKATTSSPAAVAKPEAPAAEFAAKPVKPDEATPSNDKIFDMNTIPESSANLGSFPYLKAPETYTYNYKTEIDPANISDFDKEYFAVNGKLMPVEGKSFKVRIEKDRSDGKRFNSLIVEKSFEEAILALGGVKVNNVPVPNKEIERVGDKELIQKHYGYSIDYNMLDEIKTYVIKTKEKQIWIQMSLMNDASGSLTILEVGSLKTLKVATVSAEAMKAEIDATGKAILNINFDTDKATLKTDGQEVVNQISALLKNNADLKLSIEGHTDNTGAAARNKTLSNERANAVMQALVAAGANAANLKATGFGADKPLAANDTDDNKAKNRRVELVKF
jgi:OmpA-OmpF porin, OOP family